MINGRDAALATPQLVRSSGAIGWDGLDEVFAPYPTPLVFYGHHHPFSDVQGRGRCINPGSLGCAPVAEARYCCLDIADGQATVAHCRVHYDDAALYRAFEARDVPERTFIYHAFFGGRLST